MTLSVFDIDRETPKEKRVNQDEILLLSTFKTFLEYDYDQHIITDCGMKLYVYFVFINHRYKEGI